MFIKYVTIIKKLIKFQILIIKVFKKKKIKKILEPF